MKKVKIGVLGGYRGSSMINYCTVDENAEVVAICDKSDVVLDVQKEKFKDTDVKFYKEFDEFLKHDMDAVVLANYANEHAPFAIKAMKAGKHVYSEVLPVQTMKEAVELVETVESTGKIYAYGENYCYMSAPYEMRKLYKEGKLGEFEYGEGEYIHNCESIWHAITYGEKDHWRNNMYSTFYCTHSLGPIIHITGLRPVSVIGIEREKNHRGSRTGCLSAQMGIELVTLENGGKVKSIHGGLYKNSIWYTIYGSKGNMETAREAALNNDVSRIYVNCDEYDGEYPENKTPETYLPTHVDDERAKNFGHAGSDFFSMYNFVQKILGNPDADIIDVYEALDMFLPGMFAYRSILDGSKEKEIPNLRDKSIRDKWRNDTACTDPKVAGDMLLPCRKGGNPDIPDSVYDEMKRKWEIEKSESNNHLSMVLGTNKEKD